MQGLPVTIRLLDPPLHISCRHSELIGELSELRVAATRHGHPRDGQTARQIDEKRRLLQQVERMLKAIHARTSRLPSRLIYP